MTDIEKLQEIIDEIDVLIEHQVKCSDDELKKWRSKAERFLSHKYGSESIEFQEFSMISYSAIYIPQKHVRVELASAGIKLSEHKLVKGCKEGLDSAKEILSEYLEELQDNVSNSEDCNANEILEKIFKRFKQVAVQLTRRHDKRETLSIQDEYDVQDLLYALLSLYFDDVRDEEWTPSYAGGSARMDFLIPEIEAVIEVKKTRKDLADKKLREQLIIDIAYYQEHPKCKRLYCFVYDPDMILRNPKAIINDLEQKHQGLVRVFIES